MDCLLFYKNRYLNCNNSFQTASNTFTQRLFKKFSEDDLKSLEDCLAQFQKILYHNHHAIGSLHDQLAYHYRSGIKYLNCEVRFFLQEPINFELRLAVLNFLPIFSLICTESLKASMSILATMFVKLFYSQCSVCLNERCFCSIVKLRKQKSEHFHLNKSQKFV